LDKLAKLSRSKAWPRPLQVAMMALAGQIEQLAGAFDKAGGDIGSLRVVAGQATATLPGAFSTLGVALAADLSTAVEFNTEHAAR
ncbi:MAG: hypothetical protein ACREFQ_12840, partial [Stellaceae bacterium]